MIKAVDSLGVVVTEDVSEDDSFDLFYVTTLLQCVDCLSHTIIVHISPDSSNKLLMVIKKDYDCKTNKAFLHIEIETLPYVKNSRSSPVITTFLHGMYYLDDDCFTHIDYTKNQYSVEEYLIKYSDSVPNKPIDLYTERKELHYKIWCIENGTYSREIWYQLMIASLPEEYQTLLNEILE